MVRKIKIAINNPGQFFAAGYSAPADDLVVSDYYPAVIEHDDGRVEKAVAYIFLNMDGRPLWAVDPSLGVSPQAVEVPGEEDELVLLPPLQGEGELLSQ